MNEGMIKFLKMNSYQKVRCRFISSFFKNKRGKFLDIGCCQGALKEYLHLELDYFGVDGVDNNFKSYLKLDLNFKKLPFKDSTFDAVNCSAVLEHVFYPLDLLRDIKRVMKNDGILLISLPNDKGLSSLFNQIFLDVEEYDISVYGHHWRFSIETAREFFEKEFKIIKEAPEYGPLFRKYLPFLMFKPFCTEWFMLGVKK